MDSKRRWITTLVIYYCNVCLGISIAFIAPALIEFKDAYSTDMRTISLVMTISRYILISSSLAFGFIFGVLNRHATVTVLVALMATSLLVMPFVSSFIAFAVLYALLLFGVGGYVTAQAAWVIDIWKDKAGPYIQGQHFFYAVGCFIPPLLYAPFLKKPDALAGHLLNGTEYNFLIGENATVGEATTETILAVDLLGSNLTTEAIKADAAAQIYTPTLICGGFVGVGAFLLFTILVAFKNAQEWSTSDSSSDTTIVSGKEMDKESEASAGAEGGRTTAATLRKVFVIGFAALFIGAFESIEIVTNQYLVVYAKYSGFDLPQADGAQILSACSIAFTLTRFAAIFIIMKADSRFMLLSNAVIVSAADILLLAVGNGGNVNYLWAGAVMLGIGFATSIPTLFVYLQKYVEITNLVASILMVGGACIASSFPAIVGAYIESFPDIVLYLSLGTAGVAAFSFFMIMILVRGQKGKL